MPRTGMRPMCCCFSRPMRVPIRIIDCMQMKRLLLFLSLFLPAVGSMSAQTAPSYEILDGIYDRLAGPFTEADEQSLRILGLSRLWAEVKRNFVFMDRVEVNWDSLYVANIPAILAARDRDECFMILQRMAARLGDGHTYVYGRAPEHPSVPVTTVMIDGRVYIDRVQSSELCDMGLRRGMEIVAVGGVPVIEYGESRIMPYVSSSTPQWTVHRTFEGSDLLGGKTKDTLNLLLSFEGRQLSVPYVLGSARRDLPSDDRTLSFEMKRGGIGYLRIRNFMDSYFEEKFDELYPQLLKTSALIIDVRDNDGGNSGNANYVLRHLSKDSVRTAPWSSPIYIPAYASWSVNVPDYRSESGYMAPAGGKEIYDNPIAVLIDGGTFSAAEDLCSMFAGMKRGAIIGSKTGGSTGNGVRVELIPDHTYANICSKHDLMPDGTEFVGIGIVPDIEVSETYESYFEDAEDAAVKTAEKHLQSVMKTLKKRR